MKRATFVFFVCILFISFSCSKDSASNNNATNILGKWTMRSSTIYDITGGASLPYRRLDHPIIADSLYFYNDGSLISYGLTYNLGMGKFSYSFNADQTILNTTVNGSFSYQVLFPTTNLLILSREFKDTVSIVPFEVKQLKAIDSLNKQ